MEITFEYEPREQFTDFHHRSQRWGSLVCHRRAGKTVACINEVLTRATYTQKKDARFAYIAPFYRQAKDVAWQYLKSFGEGTIIKIRESELRVELFNGAWITLYGADNPDALRGLYLDGVVLDEYGDCRPSLWGTVVLPTLADRKGWAVFIGTPKGKNHFYEVHTRACKEDNWFNMTLKASESGIIDQSELAEMRAQMSPEEYQQEMECDFEAAVKGTYFADIIQQMEQSGKISPERPLWDPTEQVHCSTDLGYTDSTAIWFWQDTIHGPNIIDYYENQGVKLQNYIDMWKSKPYEYGTIWLPHDAKAKTLQTGRSTVEQVLGSGLPCNIVPKLSRQHGIDAARLMLPRCTINKTMCYDGIEALRAYRRNFNELTRSFSDSPVHDWSSNGSDSFRYLSLVCQKGVTDAVVGQAQPLIKPPEYTLDKLFADRERPSRALGKLRI